MEKDRSKNDIGIKFVSSLSDNWMGGTVVPSHPSGPSKTENQRGGSSLGQDEYKMPAGNLGQYPPDKRT